MKEIVEGVMYRKWLVHCVPVDESCVDLEGAK